MSEHQVRDRIFKKYINCKQNELGPATSSTTILNIWALRHLCHDWPWNPKRNWGKLHFILNALSLPSFSFTYWSGCFAKRSNLSSARRGLPRSCPAFCWPGGFLGPFQDNTQQGTAPVPVALSSADCCSAGAQQRARHGPGVPQRGDSRGAGRINLCVKLHDWSGPQGSWLSVPLFSSLWKNSLFKRSECLLGKMGRRRQIRPEVCVQEQWKKRCCWKP